MLDLCFRRRHVLARLRASPFGEHLERFSAYLHDRGHTHKTIRVYVWVAERFSRWLVAHKKPLDAIDEQLIQSFIRNQLLRPYQRPAAKLTRNVRASLHHFLFMFRARGLTPPAPVEQPGPIGCVIVEYDGYLRDVCGLASDTRVSRIRFIRKFLRATFGNRPIRWDRLRPKHVFAFVAGFGRSGRLASAAVAAYSLRSFLRWLEFQGHCPRGLILAVPCFRRCKHASLPRVLTDQQLRAFLNRFDRSSPTGRRDYAMTLCQVDLGLRVGEVVALTLDDIDWRNGTIRIVTSKSRRGRVLPLLTRLGRAIVDYLRHGRPPGTCRHLFLRHTLPVGSPVSRALYGSVIGQALAEVEGCAAWKGTHVLRHTAATRMYSRGVSLKAIADVLGHRSLDTTAIYTKVDQTGLVAVALPWPGEGQP
jgi:site-specific recombinase XerD